MMVTLLLYAYCIGERSSRRIERRCQEDIAFRVITANAAPDHSTIARFRQTNQEALSTCFTQVLRLCAAAGLVRVGVVALDGTKVEANASLYANRSLEAIDAEVQGMLAEAAATDRVEDKLLGKDNRGDELPEGLRSQEGRLRRLKECKARLEAEDVKARYEAELARRAVIEAETGRRPVGRPPKLKRPAKNSLVANPTDPDSRVMKRQYTYLQGYNAQAVVSEDHIVLAASLTQESVDVRRLHPMLHEARANLASTHISKSIGEALADSGYYSEANLAVAEQKGPNLLVAVVNEQDQRRGEISGKGVFKGPRGRVMQDRLATERTLYAKRAHTVEPVFGHIKDVRRVKRFARRAWAHATPNGSWFAPRTTCSSCGGTPGSEHRGVPVRTDHEIANLIDQRRLSVQKGRFPRQPLQGTFSLTRRPDQRRCSIAGHAVRSPLRGPPPRHRVKSSERGSRTGDRGRRPSPPGEGAFPQGRTTEAPPDRQGLPGRLLSCGAEALLGILHRSARHPDALATRTRAAEMDVQAESPRPSANRPGSRGAHLPYGKGEPAMGLYADQGGVPKARGERGCDHGEEGPSGRGARAHTPPGWPELERVPACSGTGDLGMRLLHHRDRVLAHARFVSPPCGSVGCADAVLSPLHGAPRRPPTGSGG